VFESDYLSRNLIQKVRNEEYNTMVFECNFPSELLQFFDECRYFARSAPAGLGMAVPASAAAIIQKEERLRVFRENVCVAVHKYNHIVASLEPEERRLFAERIGGPHWQGSFSDPSRRLHPPHCFCFCRQTVNVLRNVSWVGR